MPKVKIVNGQIHMGAPPLIHQLYLDGKLCKLNFEGEAQIIHNKIRIPNIGDFTVDPNPTISSQEYLHGWKYALSQTREYEPKKHSGQFYQGWMDGWKAKRKAMENE